MKKITESSEQEMSKALRGLCLNFRWSPFTKLVTKGDSVGQKESEKSFKWKAMPEQAERTDESEP